ncbi:MAG: hypothetical protein JO058_17320 [Alphaproteobacteria bacterium]|nr:hypothetical protein [Alphaproteobacteria bacterium]
MRTIARAAAFIAAAVFASSVEAQAPQIGLPDVSVTAPMTTVRPQRDSMIANWRNEEDKFVEAPCGTTRLTATAGNARCLVGYRLENGLTQNTGSGVSFCDMGLDVVMYTAGSLAVEADILSFDPYKITAWGFPNKYCFIAPREIGVLEFQDLNQVTRRGKNFGGVTRTSDGDSFVGFVEANRICIAMERLGPRWRGGHSWVMHASICRTDAQPVSTQDIAATTTGLLIRVYDPVGNLRGPPAALYSPVR